MQSLSLSEDQVLFFRARRGYLAGVAAESAEDVARRLVGVQGQVLGPALLALSQRLADRPTADRLKEELLERRPRRLVRTWGQRDTLHVFDAATDWERVVAARADWASGGRRGDMPPGSLMGKARRCLSRHRGPIARSDLFDLLPDSYVAEIRERVNSEREALRFGAGRLIWKLAVEGVLSLGGKKGSEQLYPRREDWFPELAWGSLGGAEEATKSLTERYLRAYGPATPQDVAHFFGAKVSAARRWLKLLGEERDLRTVVCGERRDLMVLAEDEGVLAEPAPRTLKDWPVRLLPGYDSLLMAHADKSWTTPVAPERPAIWKKAAVVAPVILARGRIVGTWSHEVKRGTLILTVFPLSGWRSGKHLASVRKEGRAVASHLQCDQLEVRE